MLERERERERESLSDEKVLTGKHMRKKEREDVYHPAFLPKCIGSNVCKCFLIVFTLCCRNRLKKLKIHPGKKIIDSSDEDIQEEEEFFHPFHRREVRDLELS